MNKIEERISHIVVDVTKLTNLRASLIEILEQKFIRYTNESGVSTIGRCIAQKYYHKLELINYGNPVSSQNGMMVPVRFRLHAVEFPPDLVLTNCVKIGYEESDMGFSDVGSYKFELDTEDSQLRECVKVSVESRFLLPIWSKNLAKLQPGEKTSLVIVGGFTYESNNLILCNCMCNDGIVPVFKLNLNFPNQLIGVDRIDENAYYKVENKKVVKTKDVKEHQIVPFMSNQDLLEFIKYFTQK